MKYNLTVFARDLKKKDWLQVGGTFTRIKKIKKIDKGVVLYLIDVNDRPFAVLATKNNRKFEVYN